MSECAELQALLTPVQDTDARLELLPNHIANALTRDEAVQRAVRRLLGSALQAVGVQRFLELVPLRVATALPPCGVAPGVDDDRVWILQLIRCVVCRARCQHVPHHVPHVKRTSRAVMHLIGCMVRCGAGNASASRGRA